MTDNPLDKNKTIIWWYFIDKKFDSYLYKQEFAMVTTKTSACLENDPAWNQSGFNLSAHKC